MNFDQMVRDRLNDEITESPSKLMPFLENEVNEVTMIAMQLADTGIFKISAPLGTFDHINEKFLALLEQIEYIRDNAAREYIAYHERSMAQELREEMAAAAADAEYDRRRDEELERRYA